jgi:hypothetical protein
MKNTTNSFVHLHVHTYRSVWNSTILMPNLFEKCRELGMGRVAITDHATVPDFQYFSVVAKNYNIKPIVGCEFNVSPGSRFNRTARTPEESAYHLILLAMNRRGYDNLVKLDLLAQKEGYFFGPRIDLELLSRFNDGIIALTACHRGRIPALVLKGEMEGAVLEASALKVIFGDRFYLELQNHGLPTEEKVNNHLTDISQKLDIPTVATNNVHYILKLDAEVHSRLTGIIGMSNDEYPCSEFYLKSPEEMQNLFHDFPEATERTVEIAERCEDYFGTDIVILAPHSAMNSGEDESIPKHELSDNVVAEMNELFKAELAEARDDLQSEDSIEDTTVSFQSTLVVYLARLSNFVDYISEFYPFKESQIERFCYHLNWDVLSENNRLCWSLPLIEKYRHDWDWNELSANEGLPWSLTFMEHFENEWDWEALSKNEKLPWSAKLLDRFYERWSWLYLNMNKGLPRGECLLERYADRWEWCYLGMVSYPWSKDILRKYANRWLWSLLLSDNKELEWKHLLRNKNYEDVVKYGVSEEDIEPWVDVHVDDTKWLLETLPYRFEKESGSTSKNKKYRGVHLFISERDIAENQEILDWSLLSANTGLSWNEHLIDRWRERWDWEKLSTNEGIHFNENILEKFADRWNWEKLSRNSALSSHLSLIDKFSERWAWEELSYNNSLPWTEEFLAKYADKLDWGSVSCCVFSIGVKKIPWDVALLERYRDRWDWCWLSYNKSISLNEKMVQYFAELWDWGLLVRTKSFQENILPKITDEMIVEILAQDTEIPF